MLNSHVKLKKDAGRSQDLIDIEKIGQSIDEDVI